jgi:hypothetical protein
VILYGLADARLQEAVELFPSREQAEEALAQVLADEPDWSELLSIVRLDFSGRNASCTPLQSMNRIELHPVVDFRLVSTCQ